jgi:putative polyketide hydroxylase
MISTRSMEIARGWGMSVHQRLKGNDMPNDWKHRILFIESILGKQVAQIETPGFVGPDDEISPSPSILSSQDYLERVLYDAAQASELVDLRFGHGAGPVLHGWKPSDRSVAIEVRNISSGQQYVLEGAALVAADGVESPIRNQIGIGIEGEKNLYGYINCYFRADIEKLVGDKRACIYYYGNKVASGLLQPLDARGRWLSQIAIRSNEWELANEQQCTEWLHGAVGVKDLPIEILSIGRWRVRATTAERLVAGRVLICGDAAHQLPPSGGLGVNSGFRGIHNAMWKLALVIKGDAAEELLNTYDTEHRPITRRAADQCLQNQRDIQVIMRTMIDSGPDVAAFPGIDLVNHRFGNHFGIEFGSYYTSSAVVPDGTAPPEVRDAYSDYKESARPGHRAPHVWLGSGEGRLSTLDLFGAGFTILTGGEGTKWMAAAEAASKQLNVPIGCYVVGSAGLADSEGAFLSKYGLTPEGAVLVRPDGHVCCRSASGEAFGPSELVDSLAAVLGKKHSRLPNAEFRFRNGVRMKNHFVLAPMTNQQSHDGGTLSDAELAWLRMRAEGGFGMIVTAASQVHKNARGFPGQLGSYSDAHVPGLARLAEIGQKARALTVLQLFHGGLRSPSAINDGRRPTAPSEVTLDFPGFEVPRALSAIEIEDLIADFAAAARRAHEAGLSGVEIHGANGYLFVQFLSKAINKRDDVWGGSLENRARFLLSTVAAIREQVSDSFLVGVRTLAEDASPQRGFDIDEVVQVVKWLNRLGIDYLHVASRSVSSNSWKYPASPQTNIKRIRAVLEPHIALVASGGVARLADAEFAMREGADLVAVGKAAIGQPAWPQLALAPDFSPPEYPMTRAQLAPLGVSPPFVEYLKQFNVVADP